MADTPVVDYNSLLTAIAARANRVGDADFAAAIPGFIQIVEDDLKTRLRRATVRNQTTLNQETIPLPMDCRELRSVRPVTGLPDLDKPIDIVTPEKLDEIRARHGGVAGRPVAVTVITGNLVVAPLPDQTYTLDLTYFQSLVPLSSSNLTNSVIAEFPSLYFFGCMREAQMYLEDEARAGQWSDRFEKKLVEIRIMRDDEEYGASLRPARLPMRGFN